MIQNNVVNIFVIIFLVVFLIVNVVRIVLAIRVRKKSKEYQQMVAKRIAELEAKMAQRTTDLQESVGMINNEYEGLIQNMTKGSHELEKEIEQAMQDLKNSNPPNEPN